MVDEPSDATADRRGERVIRRLGIIQTRDAATEPWEDAGELGLDLDWGPEQVETVGRHYLNLFRGNYPESDSRLVEREVIHRDRIVEG